MCNSDVLSNKDILNLYVMALAVKYLYYNLYDYKFVQVDK